MEEGLIVDWCDLKLNASTGRARTDNPRIERTRMRNVRMGKA